MSYAIRIWFLTAALTVVGAAAARAATVYLNDFEGGFVGAEWSRTDLSITPAGDRNFLGEFGNDTVSITLNALPAHADLTISFDLFIIRSMDGNSANAGLGPDIWNLSVAGGPVLVSTTFANTPNARQSFPDSVPADHAAQTGATEVNTLGYLFTYGTEPEPSDAVYHLAIAFSHTANSVQFDFSGSGMEALANESWGLDNVRIDDVVLTPTPILEPASVSLLCLGALTLMGGRLRRKR